MAKDKKHLAREGIAMVNAAFEIYWAANGIPPQQGIPENIRKQAKNTAFAFYTAGVDKALEIATLILNENSEEE